MGGGLMAAKLCDSCKSATATLFCRADSAFLCLTCDSKVHAANKLASRHARVWVCEVCEHAPASVTCKADAAHLCISCDRDIHSANPLAGRHERVPLAPFFELTDSPNSATDNTSCPSSAAAAAAAKSNAINKLFGEDYCSDLEVEDAKAASWLVASNPNKDRGDQTKAIDCLFADDDIDPYLDLDFSTDPKAGVVEDDDDAVSNGAADCVVPEQKGNHHDQQQHHLVFSFPSYNNHYVDGFGGSAACKPFSFSYNTTQPSLSQSMSSSSLEVGVVPDTNAVADVSTAGLIEKSMKNDAGGINREARVLRYREKRKNRKFEKTIRYASRKAYAETRPRIKGRFAKRSDVQAAVEVVDSLFASPHQPLMQDSGYGIVPSF